MSDAQDPSPAAVDPELYNVLVTGDCGHLFPVALARIDGADFACPSCGQVDRLDDAALAAAKEELARLKAEGKLDQLGTVVSEFIAQSESDKT